MPYPLNSTHTCKTHVLSISLLTLLLITFSLPTYAQGTRADYERANNLPRRFANKVFRDRVSPHWFNDNTHFWYRVNTAPRQYQFISVDTTKPSRQPSFNHEALAKALAKATEKQVDPNQLPFDYIQPTLKMFRFNAFDKGWVWSDDTGKLEPADKIEIPRDNRNRRNRRRSNYRPRPEFSRAAPISPDKKYSVAIKEHNLKLINQETKQITDLTTDGTPDNEYTRVYWAPNSKSFIAIKRQKGDSRKVHIIESSPEDQLQPKLHNYDYLKPGDRVPIERPVLFHLNEPVPIPINTELFSNPYQSRDWRWLPDSSEFTFIYNQRGHQVYRLVAINTETGKTRAIAEETPKTFVDYAGKTFQYPMDDTNELIWMSERDGYNHLYLYDLISGEVKNQITKGQWIVRGIDRIDTEKRQIHFALSGYYKNQDPYYIHHAIINFDGSNLTLLTKGDGTHTITHSPDRKLILDTYSRIDAPPITELRNATTGKKLLTLETAEHQQLLKAGWQTPERFVAKARDNKTDIHGIIIRPTNFDPKKKYPVIEYIYAGPHSSFVPKRFYNYLRIQSMAELGFIVVQIDGMGTSNRSKAFHDVCWKNLGDSGFPDRIKWIKAAAHKYPYMDTARVGIYGGSAGGQSSTRALLAHGDFYKVAVSDCGCHDNRMDKIWWNELWMSYPIGPHYKEQSNVTQAHKLTGKLLLVVGELDRNVDPASTLQVVNALIKADKDFDFLLIPGAGHGAAESPYGKRRRRDFFVRHLLNVEPRTN